MSTLLVRDTITSRPPAAAEAPRLAISVEQAAGRLGISRASAYRLIAEGKIPSKRLGRRVVVPIAALEQLLAS